MVWVQLSRWADNAFVPARCFRLSKNQLSCEIWDLLTGIAAVPLHYVVD